LAQKTQIFLNHAIQFKKGLIMFEITDKIKDNKKMKLGFDVVLPMFWIGC
jgi:hypothetical protein